MFILEEDVRLKREKELEKAAKLSQKAQDLLDRLNAVLAECEKAFPVSGYGLTKPQKLKQVSPNGVLERLKRHADALRQIKSDHAWHDRRDREAAVEAARIAKDKECEEEKSIYRNKAIAFCLKNGESFEGGLLTAENAVANAKNIAFHLAVQERISAVGECYISFSGKNCDGPCAGWNPLNRRCQCGNRRVSWVALSDDFEDVAVVAEAY